MRHMAHSRRDHEKTKIIKLFQLLLLACTVVSRAPRCGCGLFGVAQLARRKAVTLPLPVPVPAIFSQREAHACQQQHSQLYRRERSQQRTNLVSLEKTCSAHAKRKHLAYNPPRITTNRTRSVRLTASHHTRVVTLCAPRAVLYLRSAPPAIPPAVQCPCHTAAPRAASVASAGARATVHRAPRLLAALSLPASRVRVLFCRFRRAVLQVFALVPFCCCMLRTLHSRLEDRVEQPGGAPPNHTHCSVISVCLCDSLSLRSRFALVSLSLALLS